MRRSQIPAMVGLLLAWGGTALLVSPVVSSGRRSLPLLVGLIGQIGLWILCGLVIALIWFWERQSLESLWLKPLRWQSLFWAGLLILAQILLIFPATEFIRKLMGLSGYAAGV